VPPLRGGGSAVASGHCRPRRPRPLGLPSYVRDPRCQHVHTTSIFRRMAVGCRLGPPSPIARWVLPVPCGTTNTTSSALGTSAVVATGLLDSEGERRLNRDRTVRRRSRS
jgi:hypothetical protein